MEQRQLGRSGLMVPLLSMGTGTFGGKGDFFQGLGLDGHQGGGAADRHLPRHKRHGRVPYRDTLIRAYTGKWSLTTRRVPE
jgi:hypothetical protein